MPDTLTKRLITIQRVNADKTGYDVYYPKTTASQVFINAGETLTLADHIADTDIHVTAAESTALRGNNGANSYLKLDANGFVPVSNLNPSVLAINKEFATIAALTADAGSTVEMGQLVMVVDASADATVGSGWAIYRKRIQTTPASFSYDTIVDVPESSEGAGDGKTTGWQKVAEAESLDVVVSWANIQNKPSSTVAQIDQAVADDHTHSNKAVIDELADTGTAQAPVLEYKGNALAFSADNTTFTFVASGGTVPAASTLKVGDFVFVEEAAS